MVNIRIKKLDFVPKSGSSYDLNWPGPPRRKLRYSDVKHYIPIIELEKPAPIGFTIGVFVKEERLLRPNYELSFFKASFDIGKRVPSEIKMLNDYPGPPPVPSGSPMYTLGSFWLGASKKGKIRGNTGKGNDRHARVYIERSTLWQPDIFNFARLIGKTKSKLHTVRAI